MRLLFARFLVFGAELREKPETKGHTGLWGIKEDEKKNNGPFKLEDPQERQPRASQEEKKDKEANMGQNH